MSLLGKKKKGQITLFFYLNISSQLHWISWTIKMHDWKTNLPFSPKQSKLIQCKISLDLKYLTIKQIL